MAIRSLSKLARVFGVLVNCRPSCGCLVSGYSRLDVQLSHSDSSSSSSTAVLWRSDQWDRRKLLDDWRQRCSFTAYIYSTSRFRCSLDRHCICCHCHWKILWLPENRGTSQAKALFQHWCLQGTCVRDSSTQGVQSNGVRSLFKPLRFTYWWHLRWLRAECDASLTVRVTKNVHGIELNA